MQFHDSFATVLGDKTEQAGTDRAQPPASRQLRIGLGYTTAPSIYSIPEQEILGQMIGSNHSDVGSRIREMRRRTVINNAHNSLARHTQSLARREDHNKLFLSRLRVDHRTGKYEEINFADPKIPVAGVGITLERVEVPSLILPQALLYELRISSIHSDSAVGLSKRVRIGDILTKVSQKINQGSQCRR